MRIILDECVDRRLAPMIVGHEVTTVPLRGWAGKKNGELLTLIAAEFEAFVSVDKNLPYQQNTEQHNVAIVVLLAATNRIADLKPLVPGLLDVLDQAQPTNCYLVEAQ